MPIRGPHRLRVYLSAQVARAPRCHHNAHIPSIPLRSKHLRQQVRNQSSNPASKPSPPKPPRFDPGLVPHGDKPLAGEGGKTWGPDPCSDFFERRSWQEMEPQRGTVSSAACSTERNSVKKTVIAVDEASLLAHEVYEFAPKEAFSDRRLEPWLGENEDASSYFSGPSVVDHEATTPPEMAPVRSETMSDFGGFGGQWGAILERRPEPQVPEVPVKDGESSFGSQLQEHGLSCGFINASRESGVDNLYPAPDVAKTVQATEFFPAALPQKEERRLVEQPARTPQMIRSTWTTKSSASEVAIEPETKHMESRMNIEDDGSKGQDVVQAWSKDPSLQLKEVVAGAEHAGPRLGIESSASKLLMDLVDVAGANFENVDASKLLRLGSRIDALPAYRLPRMVGRLALARLAKDLKVSSSFNEESVFEEAKKYFHDKADLEIWTTIVTGASPKVAIEQFVSAERHHPTFLLNFIIRPNLMLTREDLRAVVGYMARWYSPLRAMDSTEARNANKRDHGNKCTRNRRQILFREIQPDSLTVTISRLAFHCFRACPDVLPSLARVAADIVTKVIPRVTTPGVQYRAQCQTFNAFLKAFALAADRNGRRYMHWTWEALRFLLGTSSSLKTPLRLDRESFRAIRITLAGLEKTAEERNAAATLTNLWPPYRVDRDGMDQQRDAEVNATRTLKAGLAMQEAGYAKRTPDYALDIVGGRSSTGTPTIQTRANLTNLLRPSADNLGSQMLWATEIKATRSAEEAWHLFSQPPPGCNRTREVYAEMFTKLCAPTEDSPTYQAGDGRFKVPVRIPNLSDFEKARTLPPTVHNLLRMMARDGVKAQGHLLTMMVRHSRTLVEAERFIQQSALHQSVIDFFTGNREGRGLDGILFDKIPFGLFFEYVRLILRIHPSRSLHLPDKSRIHIQRAIELVGQYSEIASTRPFLHTEIRSLWIQLAMKWSYSRGVWLPRRAEPVPEFCELFWNLRVTLQARTYVALDNELFDRTARGVLNLVARYIKRRVEASFDAKDLYALDPMNAFVQPQNAQVEVPETVEDIDALENSYLCGHVGPMQVLRVASDILARDFTIVTGETRFFEPSSSGEDETEMMVTGDVPASELIRLYAFYGWDAHKYMKALAVLGDYPRMERLVDFCAYELCRWENRRQPPGNESSRAYYHLGNAVCAFRAFGEPFARSHTLDRARAALMDNGLWPSDEDVHRYLDGTEFMEGLLGDIYRLRTLRGVWDLDTGTFVERPGGMPFAKHVSK